MCNFSEISKLSILFFFHSMCNIPEAWKNPSPQHSLPLEEDNGEENEVHNNSEENNDDAEWFDCEETESDVASNYENVPLYNGAPITLAESLFLILTFTMRYQLSGECLQDLLVLVSLHCVYPNLCKTSVYLFQKHFSNLKTPIVFHKFCGKCNFLLKGEDSSRETCIICSSELTGVNGIEYFIEIPLIEQLTNLFGRKTFFQDLQHRFKRKKQVNDNIEDIYDGDQYKKHFGKDGFLKNCNNISFFWYTDGIPLFKSSKFSIWPMYFVINELPYEKRILKENMLFGGLWYGSSKPCMSSFLEPFHSSLVKIKHGFDIQPYGWTSTITVRGMLLGGTCDLPAKSIMLNMMQFNGKFGCSRCKQPGKHVPSGRGFTHVYPYDHANIDTPKRTHAETMEAATEALSQGKPVDGVKGPSWFMYLGCDLIRGTAVDYMHQVLLGIVRKLLDLWFSQSHSNDVYSLRAALPAIDKKLLNIKPPNFISRVPRGIAEHMKYWKASECRSFLFYYSIPLLSSVMESTYFNHYLLLVQSIFILNSSSLSSSDVLQCEQLLRQYVCMFGTLYGERHMSANLHLLLHLPDTVRDLGPLWVSSCFHFEGINGELLQFFNGTQRPELQIVTSIGAMLKFPSCINDMSESVLNFYYRLSNKRSPQKKQSVSPGVFALGSPSFMSLNPHILNSLESQGSQIEGNICLVYKRIMLNKLVYHSSSYTLAKKRNSYTVSYKYAGSQMFGRVQHYILINSTTKPECFALVERMETSTAFSLDCWAADTIIPFSGLFKARLPIDNSPVDVIPVQDIISLCILMVTDQSCGEVFVAIAPNNFEKD